MAKSSVMIHCQHWEPFAACLLNRKIHSQYKAEHELYRGTDRIRMVKQFQDRGRRCTYVNINRQRVRAGGDPRESGQSPRLR